MKCLENKILTSEKAENGNKVPEIRNEMVS